MKAIASYNEIKEKQLDIDVGDADEEEAWDIVANELQAKYDDLDGIDFELISVILP
jgi:hypothetical protein